MRNLASVPAIEGRVEHYSVIVVGAGQAGLSMSYCLEQQNIDHLVLEKTQQIASNWRNERWDAFCLVTPNWQCQLPGHRYEGDDPKGFMVKDQIIEYIQSYYEKFKPPVVFGVEVQQLIRVNDVYYFHTSKGTYSADQVVIACGSYHQANVLPFAKKLPEHIQQIHSKDYKNPQQLQEGAILVVGTGQSGCQIAEDLHLAGRRVHLSVGTAPRVNRFYRGRDVVEWLEMMGYYETTIDQHPDGENAPHNTNHYVTGRDGGRDLNLRIFAEQGMKLYGKLKYIEEGRIGFLDDLKQNLDKADEVARQIREKIEAYIQAHQILAPEDKNIHSDFCPEIKSAIDIEQEAISSVVWATGFKTRFDWIKLPAFNHHGHPIQNRGVSPEPGLYFLGLNWMNTWGSGRFFHVGRDAEYLAKIISEFRLQESRAAFN